ncbi:MAG: hypothetical protein IPF44_11375 [Betaproteobacteria bacterium]|nr:hypothetical protein [Betaproteobacteria bacterium]
MADSMNLRGTAREGVHKRVGNVTEHGADHCLEQFAGKLVVQLEFDLAGILASTLAKCHGPSSRRNGPSTSRISSTSEIPCRFPSIKQGFHRMVVDVQCGRQFSLRRET